ncbi:hypothetical protein [Mycobacterium spongiae]|uniref:Uncharacterized protein n=1 Tax=Mycobacterium spongiae TaxID=886343 RepID=A0A975JZL4_9MYCO|nr:hypothetical protein [Mycobacterium spongiae]QUR67508.1 hypothetical protein F6B93_10730 [Mycobacterium spongiae]
MNSGSPPNKGPANAHDPENLVASGPRRTRVGIASLVLAVIAAVATGLGIGLAAARDLTASECLTQASHIDAPAVAAGIGVIAGGAAAVIGWIGLTGPRWTWGLGRISAVAGLALGCLSLLVSTGIFWLATSPCLPSPI